MLVCIVWSYWWLIWIQTWLIPSVPEWGSNKGWYQALDACMYCVVLLVVDMDTNMVDTICPRMGK